MWLSSSACDDDAFARLHDATAGQAFQVALRVLRDVAQSEEVLQEAYLQVWQHSAEFDPARGSAMSLILTIVHHKAVSRVREVERRRRRESAFLRRNQGSSASPDETFEAVNRLQDAAVVRRALATLPPAQREAIELAYVHALPHTEVAVRLGIPLGTVKTRIRSGVLRLRAALVDTAGGEEPGGDAVPTRRHHTGDGALGAAL